MLTSVRIAVLRVSVAVYIAFLTCCVANCQREILTNPDFERLNDKDVPIGWRIYGGGIPESKLLVVKDAHSGERAIRLIDRGPRLRDIKCSIGVYQELPVKAGRWYRASVYAKALARNHERAVALQLTFMPMQKHFAVYIAPPIDGKFHRIQVAGRAPDGAKSVRLYIYTIHYWQSDTIVDCASLTEIPDEIARRLAPLLCWSSTGIMQVRKLNRETPIAVDGKPCAVIVHPAGKSFLRLAKRIQNAVHDATGARLPLIASPKLDRSNPAHDIDRLWRWRARMNHPNIIAIGNMLNNVVIERLYWNRYAFADSLFPGDGNYVIRTVCEPYNFHRKQNVIVLAASDVTGLQKCIREFSTLITKWREGGALTVPYTLIVSPRRVMHKVHEQFLNEIRTGKREPPADFTRFIAFGREYLRTGELGYAELAKRVLLACWRRYFREPRYRLTCTGALTVKTYRGSMLWRFDNFG
ncbi:MAG TPA: hypothetical protein EYP10_12345, partial [Armatimonadetes bacterium]|nr:hypothetical protein [Armatimonadota bacterium]